MYKRQVYLPDTERITKFGKFLRKTSIDELPSLINIIKGDMSIIGPRPLPARYLNRYNEPVSYTHLKLYQIMINCSPYLNLVFCLKIQNICSKLKLRKKMR